MIIVWVGIFATFAKCHKKYFPSAEHYFSSRRACAGQRQFRDQSRSQSFVPLDQRSENESSGSIRFEITIGNNRILVIRFTAQSQTASMACYGACLKWLLPELSFSDRWSRGTKLWERDCFATGNAFSPPWAALLLVLTKMSAASVEENAWNGGLSKGIADIAQRDHDENVLFLFHEH